MKQINSLNELSLAERKQVRFTALGIGLLTCFIGTIVFYFMDDYLFTEGTGFFFVVSCILSFVPPLFFFVFGYLLGDFVGLADLGYMRAYQTNNYSNANGVSLMIHELSAPQLTSISSSMSINPASGLPMSGSSGMDSRGNPFGTNSWS